ncbi:hypothetical protein ACFL0Q_06600, partial [Thermodesulfobacteriota bacterium]
LKDNLTGGGRLRVLPIAEEKPFERHIPHFMSRSVYVHGGWQVWPGRIGRTDVSPNPEDPAA